VRCISSFESFKTYLHRMKRMASTKILMDRKDEITRDVFDDILYSKADIWTCYDERVYISLTMHATIKVDHDFHPLISLVDELREREHTLNSLKKRKLRRVA